MARCPFDANAPDQTFAPGGADQHVADHRVRPIYPADGGRHARANTLGYSFAAVATVFAVFGVTTMCVRSAQGSRFLDVIVESVNNPPALPVRLVPRSCRKLRRRYRSCSPTGSAAHS